MFITHKRDSRHARLVQDVAELQTGLLQMNAANLNCLLWRVALQRALRLPAAQVRPGRLDSELEPRVRERVSGHQRRRVPHDVSSS